ncbi:hypothetical protein SEA_ANGRYORCHARD_12 [Rhodococcus phage AngryOrchard]|uniref:Head-to-tail connector protein n=1 Tax=Rhodococcus phage AngryOrchard TaxID=1955425 RepID=A0A1S5VY18_9CAUD|nr:hypothetical protein SEA_ANGRYORCHARD_12 [Rhodococcus phage AngryOrchard]
MPEIRNKANGGIASVSEELADKLKATGLWSDVVEAPAEEPKKPARRTPAKKAAPAEPVAEPVAEPTEE